MYLKRLDIQGFKSFADKITIEFNSGITSVVGPNGSGKSNISDAIRWVLGEQSVKSLRGGKMEDVIFSGTEHRKPLGFAEVSLTIDNSDNTLPIEFNEVTITRRVYRSGESEYMINKASCRLKDIQQLFLDTGIGKDGYSIIGQGKIDEILSTKSEDRRHIFEEASGIMKYKVRKIEAEKKLNSTQQNLLRINDIIDELEKQIEPLKNQSEAAKEYLNLRDTLKEIEISLYIHNIDRLKEKLEEISSKFSIVKENIELENNKLEEITNNNSEKTLYLKELEQKIDITTQSFYELEASIEKFNSDLKLNEERISFLNQTNERLENEMSESNHKLSELIKERQDKDARLDELNNNKIKFSEKLKKSEEELRKLNLSLNDKEKYIEDLKSEIINKLDLQWDKKTQINNINNHIENLKTQENRIVNSIYQSNLEIDKEKIKKDDLSDELIKLTELINHLKSTIHALSLEKDDLNKKMIELNKKQNTLRADQQFKTSRYNMLKGMENNLEGYNKSVKSILTACEKSRDLGEGIHGALAQLIEVDSKFETAIEMSLGGAMQNIVTSNENAAKKAIDFLKKNNLGRATFLPLTSVKGKYINNNTIENLKEYEGFLGIASDLISHKPEYQNIILSFLGKVAIVDTLENGIIMAKGCNYSVKIVTLEGDILSTTGALSGGSTGNKGAGILSRGREIGELEKEIGLLKKESILVQNSISDIINMIQEVDKEILEEEKSLKDNEILFLKNESQLNQINENLAKLTSKIDMLNEEKNQLARQEDETKIELTKYVHELELIEKDIENTKKIVTSSQESYKENQSEREILNTDITNYKISVNSILESIEGVNENVQRIVTEENYLRKSIEKKLLGKNANTKEIDSLDSLSKELKDKIGKNINSKESTKAQIEELKSEKSKVENTISLVLLDIQEKNKTITLLKEELSRLEIRSAKSEAEVESIQNRMWDEYELTYTNAQEYKKEIENISLAQKEIQHCKNKMKSLGTVNIGAIDEYVKVKERFEFMSTQRDDLEQSKTKLNKIIHEITEIMKKQFIEQFDLINKNFNIVFRELFDGGRAELKLIDRENVLESGIEIEVQPSGKKLQNMMLLSGGERAFTAIALLFAILKLRPSPFCLLDEIEAALDDANVHKFGQYIKQHVHLTQFLVITHRKGTMEASDSLYGVTMQEYGVSKVVSMKLGEKVS